MLTPGTILENRHKIIDPIAQGGFGAVYRATDIRLDRVVAVKENEKGDRAQFSMHTTSRNHSSPDIGSVNVGFRCAQ